MSFDARETTRGSGAEAYRAHSTLPGRDYYAPEIFELERERIFHGKWACVGRVEHVAEGGDFLVRDVIDESVLIVRDGSRTLRAFYNVCRHRGSRLCDDAQGNLGRTIRCPYHSWAYALDGRLMGTPNVTETEGFDRGDFPLHSVALDTWEGFIFVNLAAEPGSLRKQLGLVADEFQRYHTGDLRVGRVIEYSVAANWKIIVENYSECLHCPGVHPDLCKIVPLYRKGLVVEPEGGRGNKMIEGATTFSKTGRSTLPPLPDLSEEDKRTYYGALAFPNLILNFHSDHVMTYRLDAVSPTHTKVVSEFLFEPSTLAASGFDPTEVVEFWDLVSRQDWGVCERTQKGVRSRAFRAGVYPPEDRNAYEFNQLYLRERGDASREGD